MTTGARIPNHLTLTLTLILAAALAVGSGMLPGGPTQIPLAHASGATLTVTTTADSGPGSLRAAITQANADVSGDIINFSLPSGSTTITPGTPLPSLRASGLTIDGYSQPGASPNTNPIDSPDNAVINVQLDGSNAGTSSGLYVDGQNEVIEGLSITNFSLAGVEVESGSGLAITGDFIGLTPSGAPAGNFDGVYASANFGSTPGTTIGGTTPPTRNVISGNANDGVYLADHNDTVEGSYVGTDLTGTAPQPNGQFGVELDGAQTSTIGGTSASSANVISGNGGDGIHIWDGAAGNTVEGNFVGTDATGMNPVANDLSGVLLDNVANGGGTTGNTIGPNNVIGGNIANGVELDGGSGGDANNVAGNLIGLTVNGGPLGNGRDGVYAHDGASGDVVGGATPYQGNSIADNSSWGVQIGSSATDGTTHVAVIGNQIYGNVGGIDLTGSTPATCSQGAPASGQPNDGIPCPTITAEPNITSSNHVTEIDGQAPTNSSVEVWTATNGAGDSLHGGSQVYLGTVTANGSSCGGSSCPTGTSSWSLAVTGGTFASGFVLVADQPVTATATLLVPGSAAQNDTSEFAQDFATLSPTDTTVVDSGDGTTPGLPCDNATGSFTTQINLRCAISEANLFPNQTVTFSLTSGYSTITPSAALPSLQASGLTIDGYSQLNASPNTNPIDSPDNAVINVQLDGSSAGTSAGLYVDGQNEVIEGLSITNFSLAGVEVDNGSGLTIIGNFIGLTPSGTPAGNFDGVDASANLSSTTPGTTIGGTTPATRNVISGNSNDGVYLADYNDTVEGSYVGTDLRGTAAQPNGQFGVELDSAQFSVIGGTTPTSANVISGNAADGIHIWDGATGNTVDGNLIGTDATGMSPLANGGSGVLVNNLRSAPTTGNTIGPSNVIGGNTVNGVELDGGSSGDANNVAGNLIGLAVNGGPLGNGADGVYAHDGANGDVIGGAIPGQGNSIADNGLSGVQIGSSATDGTTHVAVRGNQIFHNMTSSSVTPGAAGEIFLTGQNPSGCSTVTSASGAPNDGIPCPVVTTPTSTSSVTVKTCGGCTVDLFTYRDSGPNDEHAGGSLVYLGSQSDAGATCVPESATGCTDAQGSVTFTGLTSTASLTATATSPDGSETSAFAQDVGPTVARVASFTARRHGKWVTFGWHVMDRAGIAGFDLYAGGHRLTPRLIQPHASRAYVHTVRWSNRSGSFWLGIVLRNGQVLKARTM